MATNIHRMCTSKIRYGSAKTAKRTIRREGKNGAMRVYRCPFCEGFHLTSKEAKVDPAMVANRAAVDAVRPLLAERLSASEIAERTGLDLPLVHRAAATLRREQS